MFETRSQAWKEVGLLRQISPRVVKRARLEALVLVPLFVGIVIVYDNRVSLFGSRTSPRRAAATGTGNRDAAARGHRRRAGDPRLGDRA